MCDTLHCKGVHNGATLKACSTSAGDAGIRGQIAGCRRCRGRRVQRAVPSAHGARTHTGAQRADGSTSGVRVPAVREVHVLPLSVFGVYRIFCETSKMEPRDKDRNSDCIQCGASPLVLAGNSYFTCLKCQPPQKKWGGTAKAPTNNSGKQARLSHNGSLVR